MDKRTCIIAEAGVNHNGDLSLALELIDVAAEAGVDFVKFQTFMAKSQVTRSAPKAQYQNSSGSDHESQYEMLKKLELSKESHLTLIQHCKHRKIGFLSTAFDNQSVDLLVELGQKIFKVPSGEITNLPYLRHIAKFDLPIILSTGMSNLGDIEAALSALEKSGASRSKMTLMHCTTEYPTAMCDVNLSAIKTLNTAFGIPVGYSDHTPGIEIPIAAVALGASVIEKHFTLSRNLPGPDHMASIEPDELKMMTRSIRNIELAMGDGIKRPTIGELKNMESIRKSLVAAKNIKAGDLFTSKNVTSKRPGTGISPMLIDKVIGRIAPKEFIEDEIIVL